MLIINLSVSLFPFEPRQVTLANMKKTKTSSSLEEDIPDKTLVSKLNKDNKKNKKNKKKSKNLTPLLVSLADFLERQGYSKTLAAFKSEALQDEEELDGVKGHALDVETMYFKYLEMSDGEANNTSSGKQDLNTEVVADICADKLSNGAVPDLPVKSKEKKKKTKSTSEPISESVEQSAAENGHLEKSATEEETDVKSKDKKKKTKSTSEPISKSVEQSGSAENGHLEKPVTEEETDVKSKDKKKKRKKSKTESSSVDAEESEKRDSKKSDSKKEKVPISEVNGAGTESKDSKKRKRGGSEENESQADEKVESKDTKESRTKSSEEENKKDLSATPFTTEKAAKKQRIGSAEPKTANAFRRVEIEKVEFVDDRLQDNSYWAKHGADVGYGAKAQEVLGQVRGKDFRHEKTKKKRGSYRGGIIDQDSHSIKFNFSDEE
ncbi:hypothetical protein C5167_034417 [Papaver somniferum]|uniref:Srp40 C-terminal domain-containing protein n=1 Tax=Papaver somniferum TaxID=3469 RepID=A0A4Y7KGQ2_PAPSO|nr:nucleolar and coiled-body phosphoprotein 1-like [Papaver somniferum]RZC71238.1 hypothetical protein C5167_034417 [Papaver somniferum]